MKKKNDDARTYQTRQCVPAPMPVACPHCGGRDTVADDGVHYNTRTMTRFEHRTCRGCNFQFVAVRRMTDEEVAKCK